MLATLIVVVGLLKANNAQATVAACSAGAAAQNGITVVPSHGSVFYVDTGVTPKLDAGYVGYRVTNGTGSTRSTLWTQVGTFTGGVLTLNNPADANMHLPTLANTATGTSYFLLKGTGATTSAQTHTVRVYDDRPDLSSANMLYECIFTFSKVKETIKAAANKVADNGLTSSAAIEVSDTTPELGQSINITVEGQTGQIGAGSTPDFDIIWLTPAAVSTWPTRALRLENVSVTFDGNGNWATTGDQVTYTNQLLITGANGLANVDGSDYRITYTYRVIGNPQSTVKVVPVAEIASGTQVKHSDIGATGATLDLNFSSLAINAALSKNVTSTTGLTVEICSGACAVPGVTTGTYVSVPFRLQATSSTATTLTIDEFVDTPGTGVIFKPGSATITDIGRTGVAIPDATLVSSESAMNPRPIHFVGPFTLNTGTNATLDYSMWVPVGTFVNVAYAKLGDLLIGATSSAMSRITVTSTGTSTVVVTADTESFGVVAITDTVTDITSTSATLNGTVDPNGATPLTGTFEYGTNANLSGASTITATTPASGTLSSLTAPTAVSVSVTGLSVNTTYYYRVKAGAATGSILSFSTAAVLASPTVVSQAASALTLTTATLNGTINPNLTPITGIQFIYGTVADLSSGSTTATLDDGTGTAALTAGGSSTQAFTSDVTGLSGGTTYYYKIRACTSALSGSYPSVTCSSFVDSAIVSFVASAVPTATTNAASAIGASVATLNGTINANYASTTVTFVYSTVADLSSGTTTVSGGTVTGSTGTAVSAGISGLTSSTTYYFRVVGVNANGTTNGSILNFTTSAVNRTLTIDGGSYTSSYVFTATPPTLTSTPSGGAGTKSYTSYTTGVCTVNSGSGLVTFVSTGTCTIGAAISADGGFTDASSPTISFSITVASRTLTIDGGSYTSTYVYTSTPPTLTSTPSAGTGTKTYSSSTTGVCTIDSSTGVVTFVSPGTCTLGASIEANGGYNTATASTISFSITAASRTLTIDSGSYTSMYVFTATPPTLTSTPSAGTGTKSFSSSTTTICTIDSVSGGVTFLKAGDCVLGATISTSGNYAAATAATITVTIARAPRTLTIDASTYGTTYAVNASAPVIHATPSVGTGTISYSSATTGVCIINPTTGVVTFVTAGTCTIGAVIGTDDQYESATAPTKTFTLTSTSATLDTTKIITEFTTPTSITTVINQTANTIIVTVPFATNLTSLTPTVTFGGSSLSPNTGVTKNISNGLAYTVTAADGSTRSYWVTFVMSAAPKRVEGFACQPYLTSYIKLGAKNKKSEVILLQQFLNRYEREKLTIDGVYKKTDVAAVKRFQKKYQVVLDFWGTNTPTGYVYITTVKKINEIHCQQTLGLSCPYFVDFLRLGDRSAEVIKIKNFLNSTEGEKLSTKTNLYDLSMIAAVKRFQAKYATRVLTPWGLRVPTGRWYQSTRKSANDFVGCYTPVRLDNGVVIR